MSAPCGDIFFGAIPAPALGPSGPLAFASEVSIFCHLPYSTIDSDTDPTSQYISSLATGVHPPLILFHIAL